jgi:uncharacterized membrane protein YkoI
MIKRPMPLLITAAVFAAIAADPALAAPYSTPLHRCVNAALAQKPGEVLNVEQKTDDGRQIYEIDIAGNDGKRWELKCDLTTIRIIKVELEDNDRNAARTQSNTAPVQPAAAGGPGVQIISPQPIFKVSEERAKQIALGQYPGQLTGVVYEYSDGRPGYEIHIRSAQGTRIEVEIDGITGEVVEVSERPR